MHNILHGTKMAIHVEDNSTKKLKWSDIPQVYSNETMFHHINTLLHAAFWIPSNLFQAECSG